MNPFKSEKFNLLEILWLVAVIVLLAACFIPSLKAQTTVLAPVGLASPNSIIQDTLATPLTLTNGQNATFTAGSTNSLAKIIRQDHGMSVFVTVISTNPLSPGATLSWDIAGDGTNYTPNHPFQFFAPGNLVGTNTYWTNWPATIFNNFRSIQLTGASNSIAGTPSAAGSNTNTVRVILKYSQSSS